MSSESSEKSFYKEEGCTASMQVAVIGGAGYIGTHVCFALLDAGHEITIFDDLSTGCLENTASFSFVQGSILDKQALKEFFSSHSFDAVIHLAAKKAAGESMRNASLYAENNISGSINLFNAAVASGVKKVVFSSSAAVYGSPAYTPMDEEHPRNPENFYGYTKLAIEEVLKWYAQVYSLNVVCLRYFNAVGYDKRVVGLEREPQNLFPLLFEAVRNKSSVTVFGDDYDTPDGTCLRDYVDVRDLADAHVKALGVSSCTVNLGTGRAVSVLEAIEAVNEVYGGPEYTVGERREGDPAVVFASNELAFEKLGWRARYTDLQEIVLCMGEAYGLKK